MTKQLLSQRLAESGITNLDGCLAKEVAEYFYKGENEAKFGVSFKAYDGYFCFSSIGFHTIYKRNGRKLEMVQLMGTKTLYEVMRNL
jgi:hypothetical protein